jgi:hypothetical protein
MIDAIADTALVLALAFVGLWLVVMAAYGLGQLGLWLLRRVQAWWFARRPWPVEKV